MRLRKRREDSSKIRKERRESMTDNTEIHMIIRGYYEQLYANKLENLEERDNFLESYNLAKLNQEERESLNRPRTNKEVGSVIKNPHHNDLQDWTTAPANCSKRLREN